MLYDPKWTNEPSLAGFIAWLEKQNPRGTYEYMSCESCAIDQYLEATGTTYMEYCQSGTKAFANLIVWNGNIAWGEGRQTFGGALKRAKAYAKSNP